MGKNNGKVSKNTNKSKNTSKKSVNSYRRQSKLIQYTFVILGAFFLHLILRTLFIEIFHVPTGSMLPNIIPGDHILITKYSYGYGPYSSIIKLPIKEKIFKKTPQRGDIIVFQGKDKTYVKRLIGLPGDKIRMLRGKIQINGTTIKRNILHEPYIGFNQAYKKIDSWSQAEETLFNQIHSTNAEHNNSADTRDVHQNAEQVVNNMTETDQVVNNLTEKRYVTISKNTNTFLFPNTTSQYVVPAKHYFFLGDNRDFSLDSRFLDEIGFVHENNLKGKAVLIVYNSKSLQNHNKSLRVLHKLA